MIEALAIRLVYRLIGESLTFAFGLPIPGPVIGLAAAQGQGVARGLVVSEEMGAFAGLAMLTALASALLLPFAGRWLLSLP